MRKAWWAAVAGIVGLAALAVRWPWTGPAEGTDRLAALGLTVTGGAAPGYVEDRACALCHQDLASAYQHVGMARSFFRPQAARVIEDFATGRYRHEASGEVYEMALRGDDYLFRRYQPDPQGAPEHVFEQQVDWILGSGNHSRVYLYRTPGGELFQLPLAWYSQGQGWGMAPGFDRPDHQGVLRRVRRECMFCHNAYPDVPAGSDAYGQAQTFPAELPEGTGCQRCHGPGAEHSRLALAGASGEAVRAAVVNPAQLAPRLRDDVCYQCHLQPSVTLPGVRRFGRGDYAFRPGQALASFRVDVDVAEENRTPDQRFEINHHPYRLEQSPCFSASAGALSCLTCHDPHRKVPAAERAEHFRRACLTCHQSTDCQLPGHGGDCASCHMPKRRTEDVIHVAMTDHRIQRPPAGDLLAPRAEREPILVGVTLRQPESPPALGEVYRALAVVQAAGAASPEAVKHLETSLAAARPPDPEPYAELAHAQLQQGRYEAARDNLEQALRLAPGHPQALDWLAIVEVGLERRDAALARLEQIVAASPERLESRFNLARLLAGAGRHDEAAAQLEQLLALRPNLPAGWFQLGNLYRRQNRLDDAAACYRRSLEIDPRNGEVRHALAELRPAG